MTIAWIDNEIEKAVNGVNSPQNVRDFALLCIARENLLAILNRDQDGEKQANNNVVPLNVYNADLSAPTMDDVDDALGRVMIRDEQDRKKMRDARTIMNIMHH